MPNSNHFLHTRVDLITLKIVKETEKSIIRYLLSLYKLEHENTQYTENELDFISRMKRTMLQSARRLQELKNRILSIT
jgi:hypothetical protein